MNPDICAVDFRTGLIYCLSNQRSLIAFDPVHRNMTVIRSYVAKWTSLAIFHDTIIFTDYSSDVIGQISTKPTNKDAANDLLKVSHPFGVQIFHPDVQIGKLFFVWFNKRLNSFDNRCLANYSRIVKRIH